MIKYIELKNDYPATILKFPYQKSLELGENVIVIREGTQIRHFGVDPENNLVLWGEVAEQDLHKHIAMKIIIVFTGDFFLKKDSYRYIGQAIKDGLVYHAYRDCAYKREIGEATT